MSDEQHPGGQNQEFKPRGTIVILLVYAVIMILLWGFVYWMMIQRGVTV